MQAAARSSSTTQYYTNTRQPIASKDHAFDWSIGSDYPNYPEPSAPLAPRGLFEAQSRQPLTRDNPQQRYGTTSTQAQVQARQPRASTMGSSVDCCCNDPICCIVVPDCGTTDCGSCDCGTCVVQ